MSTRDDFSAATKMQLAKRVGYICSYPGCGLLTIGPSYENDNSVRNIGMACHIAAASSGEPSKRYRTNMTSLERKNINNGIWMCYKHGKQIDTDESHYTIEILKDWKNSAEELARIMMDEGLNYFQARKRQYELHDIIERIETNGDKTRNLIEEFRKELRRELEDQKNNILNPYTKYVGNLVDFFSNIFEDDRLDIEVSVKMDSNIYIFCSHPLKVDLKRIEFYVEESRLVFLSTDFARRDIGLPISDSVASYLIEANEIKLVHLELPTMEVINSLDVSLKVYF